MENLRSFKQLLETVGPGLLFASAAIGTSHLVLSTRAGAHHGMVYFWIIAIAMLLKYPFYEFGPRYANATGHSLVKGYRDQGTWAVLVFLFVISLSMFAVVGAIGALSAGLLSTTLGIPATNISMLAGAVIGTTVLVLLIGGFAFLDKAIKCISLVLLISVLISFFSVLKEGPVAINKNFVPPSLLEGSGLALLIGLLGWMPAGMEASTMNSIWVVEKVRTTKYMPKLRESLFDFNLGYVITLMLALVFLTIGAFTSYGTGKELDGNASQFSNKLFQIFTQNLGEWSYYIIAISAFGAIYGTLITVMDAYPRCFIRGIRVLKFKEIVNNEEQLVFLERGYKITLVIVALGAFCLFYFSATKMIQMLSIVTIVSFLLSPLIAFINLKAMLSPEVPVSHKPSSWMLKLAYLGLIALVAFSLYYLMNQF